MIPEPEGTTTWLLRDALAGDRQSFGELAARLSPLLEAVVRRRWPGGLGGQVTVDDVVQDVWLRVMIAMPGFEERPERQNRLAADFVRYAGTVAQNRLRDLMRDLVRRRHRGLGDTPTSVLRGLGDIEPGVVAGAVARESAGIVRAALAGLESVDRDIVTMHVVEGMTFAEIAVAQGSTRDGVRSAGSVPATGCGRPPVRSSPTASSTTDPRRRARTARRGRAAARGAAAEKTGAAVSRPEAVERVSRRRRGPGRPPMRPCPVRRAGQAATHARPRFLASTFQRAERDPQMSRVPLSLLTTFALSFAAPAQLGVPQPEPAVSCGAVEPVIIGYGEHTSGCSIATPVDIDAFEFCGEMGDNVWIHVDATADNMDPVVEVYDDTGAKIASGSCGNRCSFALPLVLPSTGTYRILIFDGGTDEAGSYVLQLETTPPERNPPALLYNVPVTDSINRGTDVDYFVFSGAMGSQVRLSVNATFDNMDPVVEIYDPTGMKVGSKSCGNRCSFTWDLTIAVSGMHTIVVYDGGMDEAGTYQLGLQCVFGACPSYRPSAWTDLGSSMRGSAGRPRLYGGGTMLPGPGVFVRLEKGAPNAAAFLIAGTTRIDQPAFGGTLVPLIETALPFVPDQAGNFTVQCSSWPAGVPSGLELYMQAWIMDPAGPMGWAASNAVVAITP